MQNIIRQWCGQRRRQQLGPQSMESGERTAVRSAALARVSRRPHSLIRRLLWRAWAGWRPIYGGAVLYYTSLREQCVYKRAARLYYAGKSGRALAAWLRRATPTDGHGSRVCGQPAVQEGEEVVGGSRSRSAAGGVAGPGE